MASIGTTFQAEIARMHARAAEAEQGDARIGPEDNDGSGQWHPAREPDPVWAVRDRWHQACGMYFNNPTQENHDIAERRWEDLCEAEAEQEKGGGDA